MDVSRRIISCNRFTLKSQVSAPLALGSPMLTLKNKTHFSSFVFEHKEDMEVTALYLVTYN